MASESLSESSCCFEEDIGPEVKSSEKSDFSWEAVVPELLDVEDR